VADFDFKIEEREVDDLVPADWNPREIDDESFDGLEKCILRYGLVQPIVWNERTHRVVGGHQRLKVLKKNGAKNVKVVVVDLSDDEEKALGVALNNEKLQGNWTDGLRSLLASISDGSTLDGLMTDDLVESLHRDDFGGGVSPLKVTKPPKMRWTIVAVPEGKEGEADPYIEAISKIDGAFVETTG